MVVVSLSSSSSTSGSIRSRALLCLSGCLSLATLLSLGVSSVSIPLLLSPSLVSMSWRALMLFSLGR